MDNKYRSELYNRISKAREACAGSNIQPIKILKQYIKQAIQYAIFCGAKRSIQDRLMLVEGMILNIKSYGDRLEPDRILCDILNELLEEWEE